MPCVTMGRRVRLVGHLGAAGGAVVAAHQCACVLVGVESLVRIAYNLGHPGFLMGFKGPFKLCLGSHFRGVSSIQFSR